MPEMPDKLDMPDWKNPANGTTMRWDPASHRYVEGEDYEGDPPTTWSGAGQTLDPAQHRLKPKNPEQTGIMAAHTTSNHIDEWHDELDPFEPGAEVKLKPIGGRTRDGRGKILWHDESNKPGMAAKVVVDWGNGEISNEYAEHLTVVDDSLADAADELAVPDTIDSIDDSPEQIETLLHHASHKEAIFDNAMISNAPEWFAVITGLELAALGVAASASMSTLWKQYVEEYGTQPASKPFLKQWVKGRIPFLHPDLNKMHQASAQCPNCGGIIGPDGACESCEYQQFSPHEQYDVNSDLGPFPERVPRENYDKVDRSYPSLASAPANLKSEMRSFPEHESSWEHDLRESADASLDECPECAGPVMEGKHGAVCKQCGLKQPAVTASRKTAFLQALLAPLLMGAGEAGAVAGGAAAAAGGAELAGGAAAAGGAGGLMGGVSKVMNAAKANPIGMANLMLNGDEEQAPQGQAPVGPASAAPVISSKEASPDTNHGWQVEFVQRGESDNPEYDGTRGFQEQHSDAPEFLKDVNDSGGTKTEGDEDSAVGEIPEELLKELEGLDDSQIEALTHLGDHIDHIIGLADSEDGESDEIFQMVDEALEAAFPGYRSDDEGDKSEDKKESSLNTHDMLEKVAARRPKLCPAHGDLIDASLIEGKSLLGQFAPSNYGSNYCKSPDFDSKCNFKPAMTTQKFWDDKDEATALRKQEREQAAQDQRADDLAGTTLDPAEHEVDFGDEAPAEPTADVELDSAPAEYAPGLSEAPSAVGGPMPVAASAKTAAIEVGTPVRKRSMNPSHDDPVGVVVALTTVHPSSPGRATVRFEAGHEESIPVADLEAADGGGADHPTMDHGMDAAHPFEDEMSAPSDMDPTGNPYNSPAGTAPYSYASVKEAEHDHGSDHAEDADGFDFGHGERASESESAVAQDGQHEAGVKDEDGNPLKEGSTYMMGSEEYSVPDKVTIDKIAGSDITYTIHTGQMDFQDVISVGDLELQKLTFKTVESKPAEGSPEDQADDVPAPTIHQDADDGGNLSDFKEASEEACKTCEGKGEVMDAGPFDYATPCPDCKKEKTASLDEHFMFGNLPVAKTAGKDYSSREIRELIEEGEGSRARNHSSLDLTGTHYPQLDSSINTDDWLW